MKGRIVISFYLLVGFFQISVAQQVSLINDFLHNPGSLNPAMVGWEDITAVTAMYRHQWTDMPQNPITANLNFRHFYEKHNMAIGAGITHDQTGPTSMTGLNLQYAYHLKFKPEDQGQEKRNRLSIGLTLSLYQYRLDGDKLRYNDAGDPIIVANTAYRFLPDAGVGLFYYNDLYYVGVSVPQILSLNVQFESDNALSNIRRVAHFNMNAGIKIPIRGAGGSLTKSSLKEMDKHVLIPSIWLKYAPTSPLNFFAGMRYMWHQSLLFGFGGATDGSLVMDMSMLVKKRIRIGYTFSLPVNGLLAQTGTNHEIVLSYLFGAGGNGWFFSSVDQQMKHSRSKK